MSSFFNAITVNQFWRFFNIVSIVLYYLTTLYFFGQSQYQDMNRHFTYVMLPISSDQQYYCFLLLISNLLFAPSK